MKIKIKKLIFVTLFLLIAVSHGFSQSFSSSHVVGDKKKTYKKILVVVKAKNAAQRIQAEDDLVAQLKGNEIEAEPSYLRLSEQELKTKEKDVESLEKFVSILIGDNFEGILVTTLVDAEKSIQHNPAQYYATSAPVRYGRFGRYYGTTSVAVYEPGSIEQHSSYVLESLLYDLRESTKENSLHWVGLIKVTDPTSFEKASRKYAKTVVKKLTKEVIE